MGIGNRITLWGGYC